MQKVGGRKPTLQNEGLTIRGLTPTLRAYSEADMLSGNIDGVCIDGSLHRQSTAQMRELCKRKPTIVQPAHDEQSEYRLMNKVFTVVREKD